MKWSSKVDEQTRQKIELLYKEFDKFIHDTHGTSSGEDAHVVREWEQFKAVIDKDPSDVETMHQHINHMGELQKGDVKEGGAMNVSRSSKTQSAKKGKPVEIDKMSLKRMARELSDSISRHTKDMFKA